MASKSSARVIEVIETIRTIGKGTEKDPCRYLIEYWDFDGRKLAEYDTINLPEKGDQRFSQIPFCL